MRLLKIMLMAVCAALWLLVALVWLRTYFAEDCFVWRQHLVALPGEPARQLAPGEPWPVQLVGQFSPPTYFDQHVVGVRLRHGEILFWQEEWRENISYQRSLTYPTRGDRYEQDQNRTGFRWHSPAPPPRRFENWSIVPVEYQHHWPYLGLKIECRSVQQKENSLYNWNGIILRLFVRKREKTLQMWVPALMLAWAPVVLLRSGMRRLYRLRRGLCPACGYDVRASPEKCPECGREVKPRGAGAAPAKAPAPEGQ